MSRVRRSFIKYMAWRVEYGLNEVIVWWRLRYRCGFNVAPKGWYCTRDRFHDGPCAAWPVGHKADN